MAQTPYPLPLPPAPFDFGLAFPFYDVLGKRERLGLRPGQVRGEGEGTRPTGGERVRGNG